MINVFLLKLNSLFFMSILFLLSYLSILLMAKKVGSLFALCVRLGRVPDIKTYDEMSIFLLLYTFTSLFSQ